MIRIYYGLSSLQYLKFLIAEKISSGIIIDVILLSRPKLMGKEATCFKTFSFMAFNAASIATLEKSTSQRELLMRSIIVNDEEHNSQELLNS